MRRMTTWMGMAVGALLCLSSVAVGQAVEEITPTDAAMRYDSSSVVVREPEPEALHAYRSDPDFLYERESSVSLDLWDRIVRWLNKTIFGPLDEITPGWVSDWFFYVLAAIGIVYALLRLMGMNVGGVFWGRNRHLPVVFETVDETIHGIDFDQLIGEAITARNYRRAVRLLYLKTLKVLTDHQFIDWQRDKTNHEYIDELHRTPLGRSFAELTTLFEYVWYGDFFVDETLFGQVRGSFAQFDQKVQEGAGR